MGMMADMAQECEHLCRQCDKEDYDEAMFSQHLRDFKAAMDNLFLQGACLTMKGSLTSLMLGHLQHPRAFVLGGRVHTLGGSLPPGVTQQCLSRMQSITKVCFAVAAAEFPDADLLSAFGVFALYGGSNEAPIDTLASKETCKHTTPHTANAKVALKFHLLQRIGVGVVGEKQSSHHSRFRLAILISANPNRMAINLVLALKIGPRYELPMFGKYFHQCCRIWVTCSLLWAIPFIIETRWWFSLLSRCNGGTPLALIWVVLDLSSLKDCVKLPCLRFTPLFHFLPHSLILSLVILIFFSLSLSLFVTRSPLPHYLSSLSLSLVLSHSHPLFQLLCHCLLSLPLIIYKIVLP